MRENLPPAPVIITVHQLRLGDLVVGDHETSLVTEVCRDGEGCGMVSGFYDTYKCGWRWFTSHIEPDHAVRVVR